MRYLIALITFFFFQRTQAQQIRLKVNDENGKFIERAVVNIYNGSDSLLFKTVMADSSGAVTILFPVTGKYRLNVEKSGYLVQSKNLQLTALTQEITFVLKKQFKQLNEVVVVNKRPVMHQEFDKLVVDPAHLALSSTSGFEILEKTPGIFADQDGNFYLSSATPAQVQINGREMRLGAQDLATMLKNLPPNAVQKIEIIKTPSAKNDAAGSGGVINIVLKKGIKLGRTGSVFAAMNQGTFGTQLMGLSISGSDDKKTTYFYTGISNRKSYDSTSTNRILSSDSSLGQYTYTVNRAYAPYLNYGISVKVNKNWDYSFDGNISYNKAENTNINSNTIHNPAALTKFVENNTSVNNSGNTFNTGQSFTLKYKSDSTRLEWIQDFSINYLRYSNRQDYAIKNTIPSASVSNGEGLQKNDRLFATYKSDFTWKLPAGLMIEAGGKLSVLRFNNKADFLINNQQDHIRTNHFSYSENINSLYTQVSKGVGKFTIKSGIRMENTNMTGTQKIPDLQKFSIHRTDFFPYVYISRPVVKMAGFDLKGNVIYRRSITRPVYDMLNPFPRLIDNYVTEVGNPHLKPQFTNNYEANISFDDFPIMAFGRNETNDMFSSVIYQQAGNISNVLKTYDNVGANTESYIRVLSGIPPGKKYTFYVSAQLNYNTYNGTYEGRPLDFKNKSWNFFTYHEYRFNRNTMVNVFGFMQLHGMYQFTSLSDFGSLNFSFVQKLYQQRLVLNFSIRDVFFTSNNKFSIKQGSVNGSGERISDTRRLGINLRYNFGMKKKEEQKMFTAPKED